MWIEDCDDLLCGRIYWLKKPLSGGAPKRDTHNPDTALQSRPLCGLKILTGFRPGEAPSWYRGYIYNPNDGRTFNSTIHVEGDGSLKIRGFVGVSLFGKTVEWVRPQEPLERCGSPRFEAALVARDRCAHGIRRRTRTRRVGRERGRAIAHPIDAVRDVDQRRLVRDRDDRELAAQRLERPADGRLGVRIERARGLVEDQHASAVREGAREHHALALAARELAAALADDRVQAFRQARDDVPQARRAQGTLGVGRGRAPDRRSVTLLRTVSCSRIVSCGT